MIAVNQLNRPQCISLYTLNINQHEQLYVINLQPTISVDCQMYSVFAMMLYVDVL